MDYFELLPKKKKIKGIQFILDAFGAYVPEVHENTTHKLRIRQPSDCLPLLSAIRHDPQETFMVLTMDGANQAIKAHAVTRGLVNQSLCHPREVFHVAIQDRAVGLILAHNHPSGSLDPSADDLLTTRRLSEAGRLLGIKIIDHLILEEGGFISLRERFPDYFN